MAGIEEGGADLLCDSGPDEVRGLGELRGIFGLPLNPVRYRARRRLRRPRGSWLSPASADAVPGRRLQGEPETLVPGRCSSRRAGPRL